MFGMWIKKWSRIRGIARHTVCMVLPISLLFEQNLPVPRFTCTLWISTGKSTSLSLTDVTIRWLRFTVRCTSPPRYTGR